MQPFYKRFDKNWNYITVDYKIKQTLKNLLGNPEDKTAT